MGPPAGYCGGRKFEITAFGVTLGSTISVCKTKISMKTFSPPNRFYAQWNGKVTSTNVAALASTFAKVPNGYGDGFAFWI